MISDKALIKTLEEIKEVSGTELALFDRDGSILASTEPEIERNVERARSFADTGADSQSFGSLYLVRVPDGDRKVMVLAGQGKGGDTLTFLRLAALQISSQLRFFRERFDRDNFMKHVVLGNLLPVDLPEQAKRFHLEQKARRVVFLVETRADKGDLVLTVLRPLYGEMAGGFLFKSDEGRYVYVRTLREGEDTEELIKTGENIIDVINTEGMQDAYLSFGAPVSDLSGLSTSYEEACLAMRVGRVFSRGSHVTSYDRLGLGRVIFSLPLPLCEKFLSEVFSRTRPEELDEESLMTIRQFFDDSLNIAETARHLYIHRNTLVYRLDKLQRALGLNIRNFDDAMLLRLGLMVHVYVSEQQRKEGKKNDRASF